MSIIGEMQFLERIQFFNGQRLMASDLNSLEAFHREMRWLHNQSLHQPGIGSGYAITGNPSNRQVTIAPGYALDSKGREIILTETHVVEIPPVADNGAGSSVFYDLTVSYPEDADLKRTEMREGICMPAGAIRLREEPVLCWVRLSDNSVDRQPVDLTLKDKINNGLFIVLARVEISNCQLKQKVSTVQRRDARPAKQPRIACGLEKRPKWKEHQKFKPTPIAGVALAPAMYSARIDTSSGGFQATPSYVPRLVGPRTGIGNDAQVFFADAIINIASDPKPSAQAFTIEVFPVFVCLEYRRPRRARSDSQRVTATQMGSPDPVDLRRARDGWQIAWMGIEG